MCTYSDPECVVPDVGGRNLERHADDDVRDGATRRQDEPMERVNDEATVIGYIPEVRVQCTCQYVPARTRVHSPKRVNRIDVDSREGCSPTTPLHVTLIG